MQLLPEGKVRSRWKTLSLFIFMFIAGYILYGFLHSTVRKNSISDLVAPGILFGGAVFVYMVCSLFVKTARDLQRIYVLEDENITDPLMGIYNRRYLDHRLEEEISGPGDMTSRFLSSSLISIISRRSMIPTVTRLVIRS
ncbi:MAG: GGDEF domain-containing protein [Desulfoarculaceae bacterium]|nr:GGDEF domain-containing protein [Desulfoarculaceae bacterium]